MQQTKTKFATDLAFIQSLVQKNGPDPADYPRLAAWYQKIWTQLQNGEIDKADVDYLRTQFGEALVSAKTLQGFVYKKPHGYNGDYETIDRYYTKYISTNKAFVKWDKYLQSKAAPTAVRNRKSYFKNLLHQKAKAQPQQQILNLASGPCRDLMEFFEEAPDSAFQFDCIEVDKNAVQYAKFLLDDHPQVHFTLANIFKYDTDKQYDLIWSAGLFDYFDDKTFVRILQRFQKNIKKGGELIIGNFHPRNPSRAYMEFGEWYLHHRDEAQLLALAEQGGYDAPHISIEQEALGVNLFMRIRG